MAKKTASISSTDLSGSGKPTVTKVAAAIDKHVAECELNWQRAEEHREAVHRELCDIKRINQEHSKTILALNETMIKEQTQNRFLIKFFGYFGSAALTILNGLAVYYLTIGMK